MTANDWKERAEKAEAERDELRRALDVRGELISREDARTIARLEAQVRLLAGALRSYPVPNGTHPMSAILRWNENVRLTALAATADAPGAGVERRVRYDVERLVGRFGWVIWALDAATIPEAQRKIEGGVEVGIPRTTMRIVRVDELRTVIEPAEAAKAEHAPGCNMRIPCPVCDGTDAAARCKCFGVGMQCTCGAGGTK